MLMWINNIAPILNFINTAALKKKKKKKKKPTFLKVSSLQSSMQRLVESYNPSWEPTKWKSFG